MEKYLLVCRFRCNPLTPEDGREAVDVGWCNASMSWKGLPQLARHIHDCAGGLHIYSSVFGPSSPPWLRWYEADHPVRLGQQIYLPFTRAFACLKKPSSDWFRKQLCVVSFQRYLILDCHVEVATRSCAKSHLNFQTPIVATTVLCLNVDSHLDRF